MILEETYLKQIKDILYKYIPNERVLAFRSQVHQHNLKPFSDIDLAIITTQPLDNKLYMQLKETFEESDLPFRIDLVDWSLISDSFRNIILKHHEQIQ